MTTSIRPALAALALLFAAAGQPRPAAAQCAGDCNGDGMVAINELIIGVNIALGSSPVSACASFDTNGDGMVAINELIAAVNNALGGCGPTATATPTPTLTPTMGTPAPGICGNGSNCGDGFADVLGMRGQRETCDDGNRSDDDGCPANCCVEECRPSERRTRVAIDFSVADPNVFLINMDIFLRYPDGIIDVPGIGDGQSVLDAVTSEIFAPAPRDFDYSLRMNLNDPTVLGYNEGTAATVEFLICEGRDLPPVSSLTCVIESATSGDFLPVPVEQVTCTLAAVP
jgi:hypothetical protein